MLFEATDFLHEERHDRVPRVTLRRNRRWNDHGFETRFSAFYHPDSGETLELGELKILQRGQSRTRLPQEFERLPDEFISLGQSEEYYRALEELKETGEGILGALRDITHPSMHGLDIGTFGEGVEKSLLRFPEARKSHAKRTGRLAQGELTFHYRFKFPSFANEHEVTFSFDPRAPLGRINVMVGENASGKTAVLGRLAFALSGTPAEGEISRFDLQLSPILAVSFSAFDQFPRPDYSNELYDYIGLRKHGPRKPGKNAEGADDEVDIAGAFKQLDDRSNTIRAKGRVAAWEEALRACDLVPELARAEVLSERMRQLSSGQKFAVFVITNLVAKLEPRALVLFDEPELHTHPRMLSGMMRALTELLVKYDSYAILATHSPIVLQEVPARAIRIVERHDGHASVTNYSEESFGAPLDQLVRQAFGLARADRNFVRYIEDSGERGQQAIQALESMLSEDLPLSTRALLSQLREGKA